jgi:hypothetical protein
MGIWCVRRGERKREHLLLRLDRLLRFYNETVVQDTPE